MHHDDNKKGKNRRPHYLTNICSQLLDQGCRKGSKEAKSDTALNEHEVLLLSSQVRNVCKSVHTAQMGIFRADFICQRKVQ